MKAAALAVVASLAGAAGAQEDDGTAAARTGAASDRTLGQVALYVVKPGHDAGFAQDYARHLGWHQANADPWAWYVWSITTGEHRGLYAGASLGNAWSEIDRRPKPAEDRADHVRTIDVHLERTVTRVVESRPDLGGTLPLLEAVPSLAVFEVEVRAGERAAFESALGQLASARGATAPAHGWLEVVNGGRMPVYLLVVPVPATSDLRHARLERLGGPAGERGEARRALDRALGAILSARSELWRFRPDISSCLRAENRCAARVVRSP